MEYVVKPMDLCLLENNVKSKLYGSTDAFMADAKWIQHNCIVFNTCKFVKENFNHILIDNKFVLNCSYV